MRHLILLGVLFFACSATAQEYTWTGGAGSGTPQWQSPSNWGGVAPSAGAALIFPSVANKTATNDFAAFTSFGPLTLNANGYVLSGNLIILSGGLFLNGANSTAQVALPFQVDAPQAFTVSDASSAVTITLAISGAGGVIKSGPGLLVLGGTNTYTGPTIVSGGALEVDGAIPGTIQLSNGYLIGSGTVNGIKALNQGAVGVAPGNSTAVGTLTVNGDVVLKATDSFYADILSTGADKLIVNGTVSLDGAIVPALASTYDPPVGTSFTLIQNDGTDPVLHPSGDPSDYLLTLMLNSTKKFQISLVGGTGHNSVVLQRVASIDPTNTLSVLPSTSVIYGDSVTLKALVTSALDGNPVSFYDGATYLGTGNISAGQAQITTTTLNPGTRQITALFEGNANAAPKRSAITAVTVSGITTSTTLTVTPTSSANPGDLVTMDALVSAAAAPAGTVTFYDAGVALGSATVSTNHAIFTTSTLLAGNHALTAVFTPTGGFLPSSTASSTTYHINGFDTTTVLTTTASPEIAGNIVTFLATVTAGATGTVTFYDGNAVLGSSTLSGSTTTFSTGGLAVGTHSIKALYQGTTTYAPSVSAPLSQVITAPAGGGSSGGGYGISSSGGCGLGSGTAALLGVLLFAIGLRLRRNRH